ncbi:hypothetical protein BV898_17203 [Hypsibius exemplaris]|uniref:Uncharacterized protein n=1 Tax=Hypsibius exemplaris TaxID=2072580 RepID=A0A9X6RM73_HYPEX|nr:hypothetical protein BV898_17203 [Hypsibius exemplaris]
MTVDIVFVQSFLLVSNEAKPSVQEKRTLPSRWSISWPACVRITFTLSCIGLAVMDTVDLIKFSHETEDESAPFLVNLVQMMWPRFFAARGAIVLWLFCCQLPQWRALRTFALNTMLRPLKHHRNAKQLAALRRFSVILFVISFGLHAPNVAFFWLSREGFLDVQRNASCYNVWFNCCVSRAAFIPLRTLLVDWSFILSQQVLISSLIFVWLAVKAMRSLRKEIIHEKINLTVAWSEVWSSRLPDRVGDWTLTYVNMSRFVGYFNACFGRILLVSVILDVLTVLGVFAKLLVAAPHYGELYSPVKWLRYVWVAVLFLAYATICYFPFILLHEEGWTLEKILRDFVWTVSGYGEKSLNTKQAAIPKDISAVAGDLKELSVIIERNPLTIEAGGIFGFSRTALVTIVTTVATTLLVAKEILTD